MVVENKVVETPEMALGREWNNFIKGFADAQVAWDKMRKLVSKISNIDNLDLNLQRLVDQVCKTTRFRYAAISLLELLGLSNNPEDLYIKPRKESKNVRN